MQIAAIGWEIYKWTGSAMKMGLAGGIQALPLILLALPAGHIADRYNRRTIAALGQLSAALCAIALAILSISFAHHKITAPIATYLMFWIIFFGGVYRVLRGGSFGTSQAAIRGTFRNWDHPIRRQIFAGFRCARDARPEDGPA